MYKFIEMNISEQHVIILIDDQNKCLK